MSIVLGGFERGLLLDPTSQKLGDLGAIARWLAGKRVVLIGGEFSLTAGRVLIFSMVKKVFQPPLAFAREAHTTHTRTHGMAQCRRTLTNCL